MIIRSRALRVLLLGALVAGALALWLSAGQPSHAASADQVQGTVVSVHGKAISWEDNGACGAHRANGWPSPAVTANFGASPPGGGSLLTGIFLGCVKSNATWSVEAVAANLVSEDGATHIPGTNVFLRAWPLDERSVAENVDPFPAPISPACDYYGGGYCSLGGTQTVVAGAQPSPYASGFFYDYRLDVPGSAASGTYAGSVTFTASN
jgi:hypothetical protein